MLLGGVLGAGVGWEGGRVGLIAFGVGVTECVLTIGELLRGGVEVVLVYCNRFRLGVVFVGVLIEWGCHEYFPREPAPPPPLLQAPPSHTRQEGHSV